MSGILKCNYKLRIQITTKDKIKKLGNIRQYPAYWCSGFPSSFIIFSDYFTSLSLVMVNFMCQLDRGCPAIWSNIILSVSMRVFLEEINI